VASREGARERRGAQRLSHDKPMRKGFIGLSMKRIGGGPGCTSPEERPYGRRTRRSLRQQRLQGGTENVNEEDSQEKLKGVEPDRGRCKARCLTSRLRFSTLRAKGGKQNVPRSAFTKLYTLRRRSTTPGQVFRLHHSLIGNGELLHATGEEGKGKGTSRWKGLPHGGDSIVAP